MRSTHSIAAVGLVLAFQAASAQVPDLSGIYEGARLINEPEIYPFTADGERAHGAYDPLENDPRQEDDCAPESIPSVLWAGTLNTMRIYSEDEDLKMHLEHGGTIRTIQIGAAPPGADQPHTELGFSVGEWDDGVLTIETTHLNGGVIFTNRGFPVSAEARVTERWWREPGEQNLQMELVLEDPVNYTESVKLSREWLWAPNEQVIPWNCVSLGPRDSEPDIDALRRLLNDP